MGHTKHPVVDTASAIVDDHGLPRLTMRRLAELLDVKQKVLYWHSQSKQLLLAADGRGDPSASIRNP